VVVLAWYTKAIVGHDARRRCTAPHWFAALDRAVTDQFPAGARDKGLALMRDHGGQPTSTAFIRACGTLGIQQAFTSDHNPIGNPDTARVMRTLNEECLWLKEWSGPSKRIKELEDWIASDNGHDLHSALGDKTPGQFERD
jgi:putative transposase